MVTVIDTVSLLKHIQAGGSVPNGIELPQIMSNTQRKAWQEIVKILEKKQENSNISF